MIVIVLQVTDITDAMILRNLLERLMGYGVVCVMTSKSVASLDSLFPAFTFADAHRADLPQSSSG